MKKILSKLCISTAVLMIALSSCSDDNNSGGTDLRYPDRVDVGEADAFKNVKGFYLINEGLMGSNGASLDFYDAAQGDFYKNIFSFFNPSVTHGLGDTANDIQIKDDKAYIVITGSNLIVILDTKTNEQIGTINIKSPKRIILKDQYAYVTTTSNLAKSENEKYGAVAKIDLNNNQIVGYVACGYSPDGLAIRGTRLYVANSNYYASGESIYDNRVTLIDLDDFTFEKNMEVGLNLTSMVYDTMSANIYIISNGDYTPANPAKIYILSNANQISSIDVPASCMAVNDEYLYVSAAVYQGSEKQVSYSKIKTLTNTVESTNFIDSNYQKEIVTPYNIAINPETKDIYISDAKDYSTPGSIFCFSNSGKFKWSATTGIIPSKIAFSDNGLSGI